MTWKIDPTDTTTHVASFKDDESGSRAYVKWDGCIDLFWGEDGLPEEEQCYHHLCPEDMERIVSWITNLKESALSYFDTYEFGIGGWIDDEQRRTAIRHVQELECLDK